MPNSLHTGTYKQVVKRIKEARLEAKLTQVQVAAKLKKPQSFMSKIENGERRLDIAEIAELAKVYKKSIEYFLS